MNGPYPTVAGQQQEPTLPGKVEAALRFCHFCHTLEIGAAMIDGKSEGRSLNSPEKRAYDAALACLTEFFNSDDELPPSPPPQPPPDDPKEKVPVS